MAIFDIDGTIFRSSLFVELVEGLVDEGIFPASARKQYEREYRNWFYRKGSYENYLEAMIASFVKSLKGVPYKEFMRVSEMVVDREKDQVYKYTRDLVKKMKKRGYFLLAVSQSPKGILDKFCGGLGFDKIYGRIYETDATDNLTGKVLDLHIIENKGVVLKRAVIKENLTLKGSVGVGDTESDIPMLEMVENPICFNPNQKLYRYARLNGWKIVVERKDVIYEIRS